jgi:UDPglucose 6-dehydrogenase
VVQKWVDRFSKFPVEVISNPEFLKEGTAVDDFLKPDRVVIGCHSDEAFEKMAKLYQPFVRQGNPILRMDPISAEITKYACNAFLATRISFMNELSVLCDRVQGDIEKVRTGMASDVRIGKHFLYAGAGYGGSCFPKDIRALLRTGQSNEVPLRVVQAAEDANDAQKSVLAKKLFEKLGSNLAGKKIAIWGLAFKPNTDDIREAPALTLIDLFLKAGATISAYDPVATEHVRSIYGAKIQYASSAVEATEKADAVVLVTEWNEFKFPNFEKIKNSMNQLCFFDGRNQYNPKEMRALGFYYSSIGRV